MYQAELRGKLPSRIKEMEDILTSNVFSFFKYSNSHIFLKSYLNSLGFKISVQEASEAEFRFWPRFEDDTEPDVVIIVGDFYLLIEAKYLSDVSPSQLLREIEGGKLEASNYGKEFALIIITADYYYKEDKFASLPPEYRAYLRWTNWQGVSAFLGSILENNKFTRKQDRDFVSDLCNLLDEKNLRDFRGWNIVFKMGMVYHTPLFFEGTTAKFRGTFIGFAQALSFESKIMPFKKPIFLSSQRKMFALLSEVGRLEHTASNIFYQKGGTGHDR